MSTSGTSTICDVKGVVKRETDKAFLFEPDHMDDEEIWLPKSQVEWDEVDHTMSMPGWLAAEKGLV